MNSSFAAPSDANFAELGLGPELVRSLTTLGHTEPTPIQRAAIPLLVQGRDVLGMAATGTGKTAAFTLPLFQRLFQNKKRQRTPAILVLVPTRELAIQVADAMRRYGEGLGVQVVAIYGGSSFSEQLRALKRGVDVVVATPGRACDHLSRGTLQLGTVEAVVLDEADEMLDIGFAEAIESILQQLPEKRQSALFSATHPRRIADIAARHLRDPAHVKIAKAEPVKGAGGFIQEVLYNVPRAYKLPALLRVFSQEKPKAALVFCRTRNDVDDLNTGLKGRGFAADALHGGMSQQERDRTMRRFRSGETQFLIATDVAARGLDIDHVSHVVNYDVPQSPETYVHRIGRTGRAGRTGVAITFADNGEMRDVRNIERQTQRRIQIATVPSAAQMRTERLTQISTQMREMMSNVDLHHFKAALKTLAADADWESVAAAAMRMLYARDAKAEDDREIPVPRTLQRSDDRSGGGRHSGHDRGERHDRQGGGYGRQGHGGKPRPQSQTRTRFKGRKLSRGSESVSG